MHHRSAQAQSGVVHQVPRREVVGPVDYHVIAGHEVEHVPHPEAHRVGHHGDVWVQTADGLRRRLHLQAAEALPVVQHLALQVALFHHVGIHDPQRPHSGGGQVQRHRRPQAPRPHQQHPGGEQALLPGGADLREQQVPAVALLPGGIEPHRHLPFPSLGLPAVQAAGQGSHSPVARGPQRPGGQQGADPRRAVEHDLGIRVGEQRRQGGLELGRCHPARSGEHPQRQFRLQAHVDDLHRARGAARQFAGSDLESRGVEGHAVAPPRHAPAGGSRAHP